MIMYLENCTQIVFLKRKATSDFYDKKEFLYNCSANLDYGCGASFISIRLSAV